MIMIFVSGTATTEMYTLSLHDARPMSCFYGDGPTGMGKMSHPGVREVDAGEER